MGASSATKAAGRSRTGGGSSRKPAKSAAGKGGKTTTGKSTETSKYDQPGAPWWKRFL